MYGGAISRWRSLVARAKSSKALLEVVTFINSSPMPALQFISLKRQIYRKFGESYYVNAGPTLDSLTSGPQCPQLSHVELFGLICTHIFNPNTPKLSGLRHLKLSCPSTLYSTNGICKLLSESPQLEYFSIDVGRLHRGGDGEPSIPSKVLLPSLRSLSLHTYGMHDWFRQLLETINAPAVESLRMSSKGKRGFESLLNLLCAGRPDDVLGSRNSTTDSPSGPMFPLLRHLHLDYIEMDGEFWEKLLTAYSMITEVTLDWAGLFAVAHSEAALPKLSHIRYSDDDPDSFIQQLIQKGGRSAPIRVSIQRRNTPEKTDAECHKLELTLDGLVDRVEVYDDDDDDDGDFTTGRY